MNTRRTFTVLVFAICTVTGSMGYLSAADPDPPLSEVIHAIILQDAHEAHEKQAAYVEPITAGPDFLMMDKYVVSNHPYERIELVPVKKFSMFHGGTIKRIERYRYAVEFDLSVTTKRGFEFMSVFNNSPFEYMQFLPSVKLRF